MPAAVLLFFFSPAPYRDFAVYGSLSLGAPWRSPDIDGRAVPSTENRLKRMLLVKGAAAGNTDISGHKPCGRQWF